MQSQDSREHSNSVTAFRFPEGHDAEAFRRACHARFDLVLAGGLARLKGKVVRIGHLGDLNEAMVLGTLATVEAALKATGIPHGPGGIAAAIECLADDDG